MAAKVCHKVWVVMHDLKGMSEDVQDSPSSGLPLGLGGMMSVLKGLCYRFLGNVMMVT